MVHSRAKKKQLLDNIKKIVFTYSRLLAQILEKCRKIE